jgi:hypothetical protein
MTIILSSGAAGDFESDATPGCANLSNNASRPAQIDAWFGSLTLKLAQAAGALLSELAEAEDLLTRDSERHAEYRASDL